MILTSFVHCSDLHLGNMQYNNQERFEDFGKAFSQIAEYAIQNRVNLLLISGDMFNKRNINAMTLIQAIQILDRLKNANIQVLAIEGNHDKAFCEDKISWMQFLSEENYIKLLKPDFHGNDIYLHRWNSQKLNRGAFIETENARIYGIGYLGATTGQRIKQIADKIERDGKFTIMMLHAAIQSMAKMDIGCLKLDEIEVLKDRVDYLALGHLHHRNEMDEWAFNPGAPECWDMAEADYEKGFYHVILVTDASVKKQVNFIKSKRRDTYRKEIDISGSKNPSEVEEKVWNNIEYNVIAVMDRPIVQLLLVGKIDFDPTEIDVSSIGKKLQNEYKCLVTEIVNNANLFINKYDKGKILDRESIEREVILDLIKQTARFSDSEEKLADLALRIKDMVLSKSSAYEINELIYNQVESEEI